MDIAANRRRVAAEKVIRAAASPRRVAAERVVASLRKAVVERALASLRKAVVEREVASRTSVSTVGRRILAETTVLWLQLFLVHEFCRVWD